ncbi:MAG: penicillin-binding protein 1B [Candidatus Desulfaltia sp.]|nr:penicillin-binding protein 1B [Candidatus Desulfaltia sp.]
MGPVFKRFKIKLKLLFTWRTIMLLGMVVCMVAGVLYTVRMDVEIRRQFEGKRWALPARVFARPLEIHAGKDLDTQTLEKELRLLRYRKTDRAETPGTYSKKKQQIIINSRGFVFWDGQEIARRICVNFTDHQVRNVTDVNGRLELGLVRLEPLAIANIYPSHNEDRVLIKFDGAPKLLIDALMAVEDHRFYNHHGIDFAGLLRAIVYNIKAGRTVQGGSTITQQLVKNFFLSNERTLKRKFNEVVMALLLEWHYSKEEILEAYLNEVYLGQDGRRAIHGFALASRFYFDLDLKELQQDQIALLVALVKGPSFYEPRKHPDRAKQRRNLVLGVLEKQKLLGSEAAVTAKAALLGVTKKAPSGATLYPAFLQLVRQQLKRDYQEEDLCSEGLLIFTTLDPVVQTNAESRMKERLDILEYQQGLPEHQLQSAVVITSVENGEVLAMIGGSDPQFAGYNRALEMRRSIGSLIKPVVYLTALENPDQYTLASIIEDEPYRVPLYGDKSWSPENYDQKFHGPTILRNAFIHSYNVSTVRLGMGLGLENVIKTLHRLGFSDPVKAYPSLLLGAVELSPFEVSQMYQPIAAGGYRVPLAAISSVSNRDGRPLQRYPLELEHVFKPDAIYLIKAAMHEVTRQGTASILQALLSESLKVAGKTGTTDGFRDSWFAGFSDEHLMVVWVGMDNNEPTGLTGSSGALRIWADIIRAMPTQSLSLELPDNIEWALIDPVTGLQADDNCQGAQWIPFIKGSVPDDPAPCMQNPVDRTLKWFKELFH